MSQYLGHHSDGSSIQRHSAGSHYPYVIGKQEGNPAWPWFVICPDGSEPRFRNGNDAFFWAEHKAARAAARALNRPAPAVDAAPVVSPAMQARERQLDDIESSDRCIYALVAALNAALNDVDAAQAEGYEPPAWAAEARAAVALHYTWVTNDFRLKSEDAQRAAA